MSAQGTHSWVKCAIETWKVPGHRVLAVVTTAANQDRHSHRMPTIVAKHPNEMIRVTKLFKSLLYFCLWFTSVADRKYPEKQRTEGRVVSFTVWGYISSFCGSQGKNSSNRSHQTYSQGQRGMNVATQPVRLLSLSFLYSYTGQSPVHEMVPSSLRVGLHTSLTIKTIPTMTYPQANLL